MRWRHGVGSSRPRIGEGGTLRFKGLDLNLIFALRVLLEELSVSAAAARMNVSQPAMSAALARLRVYFQDELLIQVGRRMLPTSFAESLRPMVEDLIQRADTLLAASIAFDPATASRRFRVSASDYTMTVLIGPLLQHLSVAAPGVCLDIFPTGPHVPDLLEKGDIDLAIDPEQYAQPHHPVELLWEDEHVVVGWKGNDALATPMSRARLFELGQVAVRFGALRSVSFAERHLSALVPQLRIEITTPSFSSVPRLLVGTQRIAIVQKRLADAFANSLPIRAWPVPVAIPVLRMMVQYHSVRAGDPAIGWLIRQMQEVAARPLSFDSFMPEHHNN